MNDKLYVVRLVHAKFTRTKTYWAKKNGDFPKPLIDEVSMWERHNRSLEKKAADPKYAGVKLDTPVEIFVTAVDTSNAPQVSIKEILS